MKSGSIGPIVGSTLAKVTDIDTGETLGHGQLGELQLNGPQVMLGYLHAPEKTAECLSDDGWLKTGDICKYDNDGFLFVIDRLKELIKVNGFPVAPAELEALLLTHEHIYDVAVIPVQDENHGELPCAFVVLKAGADVTEQDICDWVKERVAPYKRLGGGVVFIDEIPKVSLQTDA